MTHPELNVEEYQYDFANRLTDHILYSDLVATTIGVEQEWVLDGNSNPIQTIRREWDQVAGAFVTYTTDNEYDELDRLTATTDNRGSRTELYWDSRNNLARVLDAEGNTVRRDYDHLDRLIEVWEDYRDPGTGNITDTTLTSYVYDLNSNVIRYLDDHSNSTFYEYDALDRLTRMIYPDNAARSFAYDDNGDVTTIVTERGHTISLLYDKAERLISRSIDYSLCADLRTCGGRGLRDFHL